MKSKLTFRAEEAMQRGFDKAQNYLVSRNIDAGERSRSEKKLREIVAEYGPVIDNYPVWHPLVTNHNDREPTTAPSERCGYKRLDHTIHFLNAFVTCPYGNSKEILDSVSNLPKTHDFSIIAEPLDVQFYSSDASPILITCDWAEILADNHMIPASLAVPLMLEKELPCRKWAHYGESWESMRYYFLGSPHGSRSSLFVDQDTALTMKKIWNLLVDTRAFGPVR